LPESSETGGELIQQVRRVEKPWGYEDIFADSDSYVGKVIFVRKGQRLSLQYHEVKDETMTLLSGVAELHAGPDAANLKPILLSRSEAVRLRPGVLHRLVALEDCEVLEVSTPHLNDVVRLSDDYGRENTSAP
jgi:mannose-6-phosphate isomerase-like protein (cupin superfamily)